MIKKNLLFINDWMYGGGAERSMAILVNELAKSKEYNIKLLMLENKNSYELDNSIEILYFRDSYKFGIIGKLFTLSLDPFRLNNIIKSNSIDTVISFQHRSNFINIFTKYLNNNYKSIISERVYTKDYFGNNKLSDNFFNFMIKWLYKKADQITCNAQDIKKGLIEFYNTDNTPIKVIENSYDVDKILELSKEDIDLENKHIFDSGKKIIINIGRLSEQKGQKYLLEAFSKIEKKDDYIVVILGEGYLRENLENLAEDLKITKYIFFLGQKENPYKYLKNSDIFVFPSLYEGYPNALAEAMVFDLSIISFDFKSGARDLIGDNEYGALVNMYDTLTLSKSIINSKKRKKIILNTIKDLIDDYTKLL